jgi:pyridoxamine 5'-phosphate oxidase
VNPTLSIAPWRPALAKALHQHRNLPESRYFQLATIHADGKPANRTVVFRGFLENSNQLKIVTDARSEKIEQIEHLAWGEVCWYFTKTREQFRLSGKLTLVQATHREMELVKARQMAWQQLSEAGRLQFAWPHPKQNKAEAQAFTPAPPDSQQPLANFCLLLIDPVQVDHLELRGNPQNRTIYCLEASQNWSIKAVNP